MFMMDAKGPGVTCNVLDTLADDRQCEVVLGTGSKSRRPAARAALLDADVPA